MYLNKNSRSQSSISIGLDGDVHPSLNYSHFKHQYIIWTQMSGIFTVGSALYLVRRHV